MDNVILIRYGEIHLKGDNRPYFEHKLTGALIKAVKGLEGCHIQKTQGRYFASGYRAQDEEELIARLLKVFGVYSISVAHPVEKDVEKIALAAVEQARNELARQGGKRTFKVVARRSDKTFPMNSMTLAPYIGGRILEAVPDLTVKMKDYDIEVEIEIREEAAYIYTGELLGQGGMPAGCNGRAALLLSGGIDSPVAGHMVMKRGLDLECVHFYSFPYTGEKAKEKVVSLAKILASYGAKVRLHVVPFTDMQLAIYDKCPERETTLIIRRAMMEIAEFVAKKYHCDALVTGESIGQVASQTIKGLACTDDAVSMPVFRPCIGMDKVEIMDRARAIGSYETSILPYEDCCTIFTPKHPVTSPVLETLRESQKLVENWDELKAAAIAGIEVIKL